MSKIATAAAVTDEPRPWGPLLEPGDRRISSIRSADNSVLPIGGPNSTASTMLARRANTAGYDIVWSASQRHYLITRIFGDGTKSSVVRVHETNAHGEDWE